MSDFFPGAINSLLAAGITPTAVETARDGGRIGTLDFGPLDRKARSGATEALDAWRRAGAREDVRLLPILRVLGLEAPDARIVSVRPTEKAVVALSSLKVYGRALVPHFGSRLARGTQLLLCWNAPPETKLLDWANEIGSSEQGVIALYFGTMSVERRLALLTASRQCARAGRAPILVIDDAVMAYAAAAGGQRWSTVITAALPFSALNPYVKQGILDGPEMFYGRTQEMRSLAAENTQSLVYGGRQLGKSSLLRAVVREVEGRRAGTDPEWHALHIDLMANGLNATNPEQIWPIIGRHSSWANGRRWKRHRLRTGIPKVGARVFARGGQVPPLRVSQHQHLPSDNTRTPPTRSRSAKPMAN